MALSDFLTEGATIPAGSALKATTSQTVLPDWYTNYAMNVLSGQQALSANPYPTYQAPRVADFTPTQQQGFNMTQGAAGAYQPGLTAAANGTAGAMAAPGALATAQPKYDAAGNLISSAVNSGGGLAAAQPWLNTASQSATNVSNYMNPYTDQVVNRIGELGARNLRENIMPGIEGRYIGAGQLGYSPRDGFGTPSGMMTDTARAIRDTSDGILAQQSQALQQGYTQAQGAMQTDLSRQAGLAGTVGALGNEQQGAALTGAGQLASLGTASGNLAGNDISQQLSGAQQQANLAGMAQQYGLTGANAVTGVGAQQQALDQKNLDVAYGDFLRQQGYPQDQINNMLATFKGVAGGVPQATQEAGIVPSGVQDTSPSTASSIASGISGLAGLVKAIGGL